MIGDDYHDNRLSLLVTSIDVVYHLKTRHCVGVNTRLYSCKQVKTLLIL